MIRRLASVALFLSVFVNLPSVGKADPQPRAKESTETRYLAFQIFTGASDPRKAIGDSGMNPLGPMPPQKDLDAFVQDITQTIGSAGDPQTRLAVIFGPLAFDNSDAEIRRFMAAAFDMAVRKNVAVGFHVDDSMFWARRSDLWRNPDNVEWRDWNGTRTTGRQIEWGPHPKEIPPQMCFNSREIQAEVRRRATGVIGSAIKSGTDRLRRLGKEDLFAGVIVGWETQIGQDSGTGDFLGYHALTNRGFSAKNPPRDLDGEREKVVQEFITLWCKGVADAGVSPDKIYSHTAFTSRQSFDEQPAPTVSYSQQNHFASPAVAFGEFRRPGFSTYPQPGLFAQIHAEVAQHGSPGWASSEGTNLLMGSRPGQSGMNMETYLAEMFNHGATLVNVFSWGVGGEANRNMDFRVVTEDEEALRAYRKFLGGKPLREAVSTATFDPASLPGKIHHIQQALPDWIRETGKQALAEPLMQKLDAALKAKDFPEAELAANAILKLLASK